MNINVKGETVKLNKGILFAGGGVLSLFVIWLLSAMIGFGYILSGVGSDEVGVRFVQNRPIEVVGPGVYTDWSPLNSFQYHKIVTVPAKALSFVVTDKEVLTKDKQRLGMVLQGTVRRPGLAESSTLLDNWAKFQNVYQSDSAIVGAGGIMENLGNQALKVCIGNSNFDDAVIGSARDLMVGCLEKEFSDKVKGYGLYVNNLVIPNVVLDPDVQKQLDSITQARLAKTLADQRAQQNTAEAQQENAKQQGAILVEQGRVQEKAKQDAVTAQLQVIALSAQRSVIEAQKNNDLFAAQKDKDIADAQQQAAVLKAKANYADESAKAALYQANPTYAAVQMTNAEATAFKVTDKVIVVPQGTNPITLLGGGQPIIQTQK